MIDTKALLQTHFQPRAFGYGMGGVALIYLGLFGYALLSKNGTYRELESRLSSYATIIEHDVISQQPLSDAVISDEELHHDKAQTSHNKAQHTEHSAENDAHKTPSHDEVAHAIETAENDTEHDNAPSTDLKPSDKEDGTQTLTELLNNSNISTTKALPVAPLQGYYEDTAQGPIPVKTETGRLPFNAYKKPFLLNQSQPAVAVVVSGLGLSESLSKTLIEQLPSAVSLILSPYTDKPDYWRKQARSRGHEIWLNLPIQTQDYPYSDPGPMGLLSDVSIAYNQERLGWLLTRTAGYAGVAAYTDHTIKRSASMYKDLFTRTLSRGIGFLQLNGTQEDNIIQSAAFQTRAPYVANTAQINITSLDQSSLKVAQDYMASHLRTVIHVDPEFSNIEVLNSWLVNLQNEGFVLAPVSAFADIPQSAADNIEVHESDTHVEQTHESDVHVDDHHDAHSDEAHH